MKLLDKIAGKVHFKLFGMRCDIRPGIRYFDETHFDGLIKEDFEFKNDNGFTLRGGYYHYENFDKDTLVIFCHGIGGGHQAYMKEIEYIARNGFKVLSYDYQGSILSDGDNLGGFSLALKDMVKCIDLIKDNYKHIYVIGHSWGGWVAQGAAYLSDDVEKVVLLAGMNSLETLCDQYVKGPLKIFKKPFLKLEYEKYGEISKLKASESLNKKNLKALVIQSKDDSILKLKYNFEKIKEASTNKEVKFIETDGKNHNPTYTLDAVKKLNEYLSKLNKLKDKAEIEKLADSTNWDELCDLDLEIMDEIISFIKA